MQRRTSESGPSGATGHDLELVADTPVTPENIKAAQRYHFQQLGEVPTYLRIWSQEPLTMPAHC